MSVAEGRLSPMSRDLRSGDSRAPNAAIAFGDAMLLFLIAVGECLAGRLERPVLECPLQLLPQARLPPRLARAGPPAREPQKSPYRAFRAR